MSEEQQSEYLLTRELFVLTEEMHSIQEHAQEGYPHEVVGILAGSRAEHMVLKVLPLINERGDTKNRYKVGPLKLMRAEQELESQGYDIVGYYHSHPDHSSRYSEYDKAHALPNLSYLIVSVQQGQAKQIQSWRLREDRSVMDEESVLIRSKNILNSQNKE